MERGVCEHVMEETNWTSQVQLISADPGRNEPILCNYLHCKKNILKGGVRPLEGQQQTEQVAQMAAGSLIDRETHHTPTYI